MNNLQQRSAAGEEAKIGTFYNARDDHFLPAGLFGNQSLTDAVQVSPIVSHNVRLDHNDTLECKFQMLGIEPTLAATILAGFIEHKGSLRLWKNQEVSTTTGQLYITLF